MKDGVGHMGTWGRGAITKDHRTLKLKEECINQGQGENTWHTLGLFEEGEYKKHGHKCMERVQEYNKGQASAQC